MTDQKTNDLEDTGSDSDGEGDWDWDEEKQEAEDQKIEQWAMQQVANGNNCGICFERPGIHSVTYPPSFPGGETTQWIMCDECKQRHP